MLPGQPADKAPALDWPDGKDYNKRMKAALLALLLLAAALRPAAAAGPEPSEKTFRLIYDHGYNFSLKLTLLEAFEHLATSEAAHIQILKIETRPAYYSNGNALYDLPEGLRREELAGLAKPPPSSSRPRTSFFSRRRRPRWRPGLRRRPATAPTTRPTTPERGWDAVGWPRPAWPTGAAWAFFRRTDVRLPAPGAAPWP